MPEPRQKPGKSEQIVATDRGLIRAVEARWGKLAVDLCATASNAKAPRYITEAQNSLSVDWTTLGDGPFWCNPPYGTIAPWVAKARLSCAPNRKIILLIPAAIDTDYWHEDIHSYAAIYWISRIKFEGHNNSFPKPLCVLVYGETPGYYGRWDWRKAELVAAQTTLFD